MIRIAIVEDENEVATRLREMLAQLSVELGIEPDVMTYENSRLFLEGYRGNLDLIFMDIQMPGLSGMEAAARLREIDPNILLVFVTSLAQYAVRGYEVRAFDFLVKPVDRASLAMCMRRVLKQLSRRQEKKLAITSEGAQIYLPVSDILFVEVKNHQLVYHTESKDYITYDTMARAEKELVGLDFVRCNSCYLVNLRFVKAVQGFTVTVKDTDLQISHPKRKAFLEALNNYIGG